MCGNADKTHKTAQRLNVTRYVTWFFSWWN